MIDVEVAVVMRVDHLGRQLGADALQGLNDVQQRDAVKPVIRQTEKC